jgi:hypothetical protein
MCVREREGGREERESGVECHQMSIEIIYNIRG